MADSQSPSSRQLTINAIEANANKLLTQTVAAMKAQQDVSALTKYAIITTPRVGSSMICDRMHNAGDMGWPVEWFSALYMAIYKNVSQRPFQFNEYIHTLLYGTTSHNSKIFGVNFHVDQYITAKEGGAHLLDLGFDHVYYIERKDIYKQAYSYAKALKTGYWDSESEPKDVLPAHITAQELQLQINAMQQWRDYFETQLSSHITKRYLYEDFAKDQGEALINEVRRDLDLPTLNTHTQSRLKKQRNEHDAQQLSRLLEELNLEPIS